MGIKLKKRISINNEPYTAILYFSLWEGSYCVGIYKGHRKCHKYLVSKYEIDNFSYTEIFAQAGYHYQRVLAQEAKLKAQERELQEWDGVIS